MGPRRPGVRSPRARTVAPAPGPSDRARGRPGRSAWPSSRSESRIGLLLGQCGSARPMARIRRPIAAAATRPRVSTKYLAWRF
eukprot:755811-Hanusia_phi.AAC.4